MALKYHLQDETWNICWNHFGDMKENSFFKFFVFNIEQVT